MNTNQHHGCYGRIFPDFEYLNYDNQPTDGKAFRVIMQKIGIGTQRRKLVVKLEAWDECVACPEYRPGHDLGITQLALHGALSGC